MKLIGVANLKVSLVVGRIHPQPEHVRLLLCREAKVLCHGRPFGSKSKVHTVDESGIIQDVWRVQARIQKVLHHPVVVQRPELCRFLGSGVR